MPIFGFPVLDALCLILGDWQDVEQWSNDMHMKNLGYTYNYM
jgi:hypothetical protein